MTVHKQTSSQRQVDALGGCVFGFSVERDWGDRSTGLAIDMQDGAGVYLAVAFLFQIAEWVENIVPHVRCTMAWVKPGESVPWWRHKVLFSKHSVRLRVVVDAPDVNEGGNLHRKRWEMVGKVCQGGYSRLGREWLQVIERHNQMAGTP